MSPIDGWIAKFALWRAGEYHHIEECPRCVGKGEMQERVDVTPTAAYLLAACFPSRIGVRRIHETQVNSCWLCKGRGWSIKQSGM